MTNVEMEVVWIAAAWGLEQLWLTCVNCCLLRTLLLTPAKRCSLRRNAELCWNSNSQAFEYLTVTVAGEFLGHCMVSAKLLLSMWQCCVSAMLQ